MEGIQIGRLDTDRQTDKPVQFMLEILNFQVDASDLRPNRLDRSWVHRTTNAIYEGTKKC